MELKISDVLKSNSIIFDLKENDKKSVLLEMSEYLKEQGFVSNANQFLDVLLERESISTTGVGDGIAIPHGRSNLVTETVVLFGRSADGVNFESMDGKPVHLFFMIATPENSGNEHLKILAELSGKLMHADVVLKLKNASTYSEIIEAFAIEDTSNNIETNDFHNHKKVVAVTACATGIAHTYMAAEKLQEIAKKLNIDVKVETNGTSGVGNQLSKADIDNADAVIVAADIKVETSRFDGKKMLAVPVAKAIKEPQKLFEEALSDNTPIHSEKAQESPRDEKKGIYKHLMSGVSYMLPFVIGGGIVIALSFLVDQLIGVPQDSLGQLGSYNELAASLNKIGGAAFGFMLPVLAGYIAYSIADRPGLVAGFVAGGIASTGGAGFLGALIGGFVAGYVVNFVKRMLNGLPHSLNGLKNIMLYPLLGVLITGAIMLIVNVPMKTINDMMNNFLLNLSGTNAVILGLLLGAMMAIDLGGPVNKAAYVFGTGTLATASVGGSSVMAAVMAAGMVPPLAVFVATLFFKDKFTVEEKQAGLTNAVLGASFITEGAIPFASKDPLRIIPSFVVGSAVTGALVLASNIMVSAPHGGIFVIFLVSQPVLYIAYIAIGSIISGFIMGILSK